MLRYKVDILKELKEKDYTSYRLRKDKLIGESPEISSDDFIKLVSQHLTDTKTSGKGSIALPAAGDCKQRNTKHYLQTITVSTWWHIRIYRRWAINIYTHFKCIITSTNK